MSLEDRFQLKSTVAKLIQERNPSRSSLRSTSYLEVIQRQRKSGKLDVTDEELVQYVISVLFTSFTIQVR
jgi:hypothetical protein